MRFVLKPHLPGRKLWNTKCHFTTKLAVLFFAELLNEQKSNQLICSGQSTLGSSQCVQCHMCIATNPIANLFTLMYPVSVIFSEKHCRRGKNRLIQVVRCLQLKREQGWHDWIGIVAGKGEFSEQTHMEQIYYCVKTAWVCIVHIRCHSPPSQYSVCGSITSHCVAILLLANH